MPELTEQIDQQQWEELILTSPTASVFQSPAFYLFLKELKEIDAYGLGVTENGLLKGVVVGMIQHEGAGMKRQLTRRTIINGGPLLAADITDNQLQTLLCGYATALRGKSIYIETRNLCDFTPYRRIIESAGFRYEPHYNLQLSVGDDPVQHYHKGKQKELRFANRHGVQVVWNPTIDQVHCFYHLLQQLYAKKVHTPLPTWDFFETAYHQPFLHYIVALSRDGIVIGGLLVADLDTRTSYDWYCCSDDNFRHMKVGTVLIDAAIRRCVEQGIGHFDFMGAGRPNDGDYGVRDFKAQFGGTLVEQGRFRRVLNRPLFLLGCAAVHLLRKKK